MRVEPRLDEVVNGKRGMLKGIQLCLDHQCLVSAVTLIFSAIDALAALTRPAAQSKTDRCVFIQWAERYLVPAASLGCSAIDLYAARCGVLHLYSSESNLAVQGTARQLVYQWRSGPAVDAVFEVPAGALVVQVEALHRVFKNAVRQFIIDAEVDGVVNKNVTHHLRSLLCYEPFPNLAVTIAA